MASASLYVSIVSEFCVVQYFGIANARQLTVGKPDINKQILSGQLMTTQR